MPPKDYGKESDKESDRKENNPLTEAVMRYQETGRGMKELVDEIALRVYRIAHLKTDWDEDDAGDFFAHYYPKIPRLIEHYRDTGSSFEVYLHVHLLWAIKGFAKKLKKRRYEQTLDTFTTFWEVHEKTAPDDEYSYFRVPVKLRQLYKITPEGKISSRMWKQRFLFVILRESEFIDHSLAESIVAATGVNRKWLLNCIVTLKERMEERKRRLEELRRKRNYWFYRYYMLQIRISDTCNSEKREELLDLFEVIRIRFSNATERVVSTYAHPTNQDIADVLNIPKGSIDSGIYYVMSKYKKFLREEEDNMAGENPVDDSESRAPPMAA